MPYAATSTSPQAHLLTARTQSSKRPVIPLSVSRFAHSCTALLHTAARYSCYDRSLDLPPRRPYQRNCTVHPQDGCLRLRHPPARDQLKGAHYGSSSRAQCPERLSHEIVHHLSAYHAQGVREGFDGHEAALRGSQVDEGTPRRNPRPISAAGPKIEMVPVIKKASLRIGIDSRPAPLAHACVRVRLSSLRSSGSSTPSIRTAYLPLAACH